MKDQSKQQAIQFYNSLQPRKTSSLAPRRGYYFIQEVKKQFIPNHSMPVEVAKALWKFDDKEKLDTGLPVSIQLQTLRLNPYPGSNDILDSITHKVIHIKSAYVEFTNNSTGKFRCAWTILQPRKEDFSDAYTISSDEKSLQAQIDKALSDQEDDLIMIDNALLDQYEYFCELDNYESNMFLDIEEYKLSNELSNENPSSSNN